MNLSSKAFAAGGVTLAKTLEKGVMELFAVMRPTPPLRAQWLALCNAYTEQIADSLGRRLGATADPMVADLAAGALVGMVANVLDHVSELSSEQLAHILDESFVYFVNGFGSRA